MFCFFILISFISFFVSQISIDSLFLTRYNYYSLITGRAGELLCGSIAGILSERRVFNKKLNNLLSVFGFIVILLSIYFISSKYLFPSFLTCLPVLGTAMLLLFCDKKTFIGKILSLKLFVYIGLLSYSIYLWHWPVICLYKIFLQVDELSNIWHYLIITCSVFLLSLLTYYFIEKPCRQNKKGIFYSLKYYYITPVFFLFSLFLIQKKNIFR